MEKKQEWRAWYFLCKKWEMHLPSLDNWKTSLVQATGNSPLGEITLAGTISKSRGIRHDKPRVFGQWALVYLVAGTGRYHDARGTDIPLRAGDVILVFPELAHSYGPVLHEAPTPLVAHLGADSILADLVFIRGDSRHSRARAALPLIWVVSAKQPYHFCDRRGCPALLRR